MINIFKRWFWFRYVLKLNKLDKLLNIGIEKRNVSHERDNDKNK